MMNNGVRCVSGHEKDFCLWAKRGNLLGEMVATRSGHDDVGQQQVNLAGMILAKRFRPVPWPGPLVVKKGSKILPSV